MFSSREPPHHMMEINSVTIMFSLEKPQVMGSVENTSHVYYQACVNYYKYGSHVREPE
jgi:hypothetical protein